MHNTTQNKYHTQKWKANMRTCISSIILSKTTKPIQQTQQKFLNHIRTSYISNLNNYSKIKKSKTINMKSFEKNEKPIPFLEVWRREDDENGGFLSKTRWVCKGDEQTRQWTVKMNKGKNEKILKLSLKRKTQVFCDWNKSRTSRQNPYDKNLKNFSKFFSRLEVSPASQLWQESPNFLSNSCNWSFHSRTSCQTESREI